MQSKTLNIANFYISSTLNLMLYVYQLRKQNEGQPNSLSSLSALKATNSLEKVVLHNNCLWKHIKTCHDNTMRYIDALYCYAKPSLASHFKQYLIPHRIKQTDGEKNNWKNSNKEIKKKEKKAEICTFPK